MLKIIGYSDQISSQAGECIRFFVHSEESSYTARLVKIRSGDINPVGPGLKVEEIPSSINGKYPGIKQSIHAGSYAVIPLSHQQLASLQSFGEAFEVELFIFPTTPDRGSQYLIDLYHHTLHHGLYLKITSPGIIEAGFGNNSHHAVLRTSLPLASHVWHRITFSFDHGKCSLKQQTLDRYHEHLNQKVSTTTDVTELKFPERPLFFAGKLSIAQDSFEKQIGTEIFNGKLDSVSFSHKKKRIAEWDFAKEITTIHISDTGSLQLHGHLENLPTRGVTGYRYTGEETFWGSQPDSYSAIYFHDDDLYDAKWQESFQWVVSEDLKSGLYAVCLTISDQEEYIPFVIRPAPSHKKNSLVLLFPSATYMAYANEHIMMDAALGELLTQRAMQIQPHQAFLHEHREYGNSLYDVHSDGSGVHYSSRIRPILNMRPKNLFAIGAGSSFLWQFNADTHLIDWLEANGIEYDMITDDDLEKEGLNAIKEHRVLMTTTHPEYYSTKMYQALEDYIHTSGRLIYLGGNGFYWKIAYHQQLPGVIEVRRTSGTRAWETAPGEAFHSFTNECGGLLRYHNHSPNRLCGVGFTAQGFDRSSYYRCTKERNNPRAAFIFEGVNDEIIGDFGLIGGGAAGMEVDRFDPALGSPRHALVLASSEKHTAAYLLALEDIFNNYPGTDGEQNPLVRADMTFFETPSGGAVFSTGSISW